MSISAQVIADTVSPAGKRITTLQLEFPRFILSQFNKHRMFSSNAASSRAIPTKRLLERVTDDPVIPVRFGKNQAGMVAESYLEGMEYYTAVGIWLDARNTAIAAAQDLAELGVHKEIVNRLLEPFSYTQVIVTATEWDNFFDLRLKPDAQPEIYALAKAMKEAMDASVPKEGIYHLPYVLPEDYDKVAEIHSSVAFINANGELTLEGVDLFYALAHVSAARCARVSYNKHDGTPAEVEIDTNLANRLREARHSVCFEHQATAITESRIQVIDVELNDDGSVKSCDFVRISPSDISSGNFYGWNQFRKSLQI